MKNNEDFLKRLEADIMKAFPESSPRDAMILSGFVGLFCTAQEDIKVFLTAIIREGLADARIMNQAAMRKLESKINELKNNKKVIIN